MVLVTFFINACLCYFLWPHIANIGFVRRLYGRSDFVGFLTVAFILLIILTVVHSVFGLLF